MKTAKKVLIALLTLICMMVAIVPAFSTDVCPMTDGTNIANVSLSINYSGQASCRTFVNARSNSYRIEVTMSLNQIGKSTPLKSWPLSGSGSLSATETYYVARGHDYQVTAAITVRDSDGKLIESFITKSSIVHY